MTDKQYNAIVNGIDILVATCVEILKFLSKKEKTTAKKKVVTNRVFERPNKEKSLTSQEYYKVSDLIKAFVRERPDLVTSASVQDDNDAPEFPVVDAHDDIVDIEEKIEIAEAGVKNAQTSTFSDAEANDEKKPQKNDESKAEEISEVEKQL